ncbi:MAG: peptide ABC transporter substrate-binding protein, partial [Angelakisella sp.]
GVRTIFKRILALLLLLSLLFLTVGCAKEGSQELRLDINGGVSNLDPQFATDPISRTIIANSFEGLFRKDSSGKTIAGVAESYDTSTDGLHYTFYLRQDAKWSDGKTVTAGDFVFALQRLFHPQVPSPYAEEFLAIQNAPQILAGELPQSRLGAVAKNDHTLEIFLSEPSPLFIERLAGTASMPCNEEFFTGTRARYGLGTEYIKYNGAYRVSHWDNAKYIVLKPNSHYHGVKELPFPEVYMYTSRVVTPEKADEKNKVKTARDLFNEGKSDIYLATAEELPSITGKEVTYLEIKNRVWQLIFNTAYGTLENESVRRGLTFALDSSGYSQRIPEMYGLAESLIPDSARPKELPMPKLLGFDPIGAQAAITAGLEELGRDALGQLAILIPDNANLGTVAGYLQKQWKDKLVTYVNLETVTEEQFRTRLRNKDFSIALVPMEASGQDCADVLSGFTRISTWNYGSFHSEEYDTLLESAVKAGSRQRSLDYYQQAEQLLIDKAAAVPLFTQSSYYAFSKGTSGVEIINGLLSFQNANRAR